MQRWQQNKGYASAQQGNERRERCEGIDSDSVESTSSVLVDKVDAREERRERGELRAIPAEGSERVSWCHVSSAAEQRTAQHCRIAQRAGVRRASCSSEP